MLLHKRLLDSRLKLSQLGLIGLPCMASVSTLGNYYYIAILSFSHQLCQLDTIAPILARTELVHLGTPDTAGMGMDID